MIRKTIPFTVIIFLFLGLFLSCTEQLTVEEVFSLETMQNSVLGEYYRGEEVKNELDFYINDKLSEKKRIDRLTSIRKEIVKFDSLVNLVFLHINDLRMKSNRLEAKNTNSGIVIVNFNQVKEMNSELTNSKVESLFGAIRSFETSCASYWGKSKVDGHQQLIGKLETKLSSILNLKEFGLLSPSHNLVEKERVLLSISKILLECRVIIFQFIFSEIGCVASYDFSKVETVVVSPKSGYSGDTLELLIFNAGVNKYSSPKISNLKNGRFVGVEDGKAKVKVVLENVPTQIVNGEISYKTKSGRDIKTLWKDTIVVLDK